MNLTARTKCEVSRAGFRKAEIQGKKIDRFGWQCQGRTDMVDVLTRSWRALALRGVAAITFGVVAWLWPGITLSTLIILFGAYALVDGVFSIFSLLTTRDRPTRWPWFLLQGVLSILVGIGAIVWPDLTALALLYVIAAWAIVTGVMQIAAAIELRREIQGEFWLGLGGLAAVIFGILAFIFPGDGALALTWLIGTYAIIFGIAELLLAFELRGRAHQVQQTLRPGV
jgi:uncharacterized membrane protein HdeD (DUF308 family)